MIIHLIIIIIVIITILISWYILKPNEVENMIDLSNSKNNSIKWAIDKNCKYDMVNVYTDILKEYSIDKTSSDNNDWVIYFPCTYNEPLAEMKKIKPTSNNQCIFIVSNTDEIASKSILWQNLVKKYGRDEASKMSPVSYVLYDKDDKELFKREYDQNKIYIMKKNIQRQEGLKITNDKNEILNGFSNNYVVVQELLQDPYMIRGRKTNMRFYVLVVCQNNNLNAYVHQEGFIYYTRMPFEQNSQKDGNNITSGYIERWVYDVNPLTHNDFKKYLDTYHQNSKLVYERIYDLIKKVIIACDKLCKDGPLKDNITFQLFGVDIALDDKLYPKIMEVNVGPNLATHDKKDSIVKHKVVRDIFKVLQIVPNKDNDFDKII